MNNRTYDSKNKINFFINKLKFKFSNLSIPYQITLFWSFIWLISLFIPWIIDNDNWKIWNSFNSITWNIWYLLIFIFLLPSFLILSNSYKEKLKLYSDLNFKNHLIIINSWLVSISFSIISLSFAIWLSTIGQNILYWKWPILSMVAWILILIWWLYIRKEFKKTSSEIFLEKLSYEREKIKEKNNMKLPF